MKVPVPLPPETAKELTDKLKAVRLNGKIKFLPEADVGRIVTALGKASEGPTIAALILSGKSDDFVNFGQILTNCKQVGEAGSVLMALNRANSILASAPGAELVFEDKDESPKPAGHDIDLGVVDPGGGYSAIYQFGECTGSANVSGKFNAGTGQLVNANATRKVVELNVLPGPAKRGRPEDDGSRKFFDDHGFEPGLRLAATTRPGIEARRSTSRRARRSNCRR